MELQKNPMLTAEEISEELSSKIERLEFMPGDKISENELSAHYGVSRHVIRNALADLKSRRLVDVFPQRGTFVSLIDMELVADILFMRVAIEQEAIARIIEMDDITMLVKNLKAAAANQRNLDENTKNYNNKFYELDNEFHALLLEAVGRPNVVNIVKDPYIHVRRFRNFEVRTIERMHEILIEHDNIIKAIENRDRIAARKCMGIHIDTVARGMDLKLKESQYFI